MKKSLLQFNNQKPRHIVKAALVLLLLMFLFPCGSSPVLADGPPAPGHINALAVAERFGDITAEDMDLLRGKRILFASRSFGLNLMKGFAQLKAQDPKYTFPETYTRFDVFKAGGDLSVIPADAFEKANFVHFLASYWPHTLRLKEVDTLMRKLPHNFGGKVDAVVVFFHTAGPETVEPYQKFVEGLRLDFPKVKVICVTAGFMGPSRAKDNERAHAFSEEIRKLYRGKAPLYDLGAILSKDFEAGKAFAPDYTKDPAEVHPDLPAGETAMAKGMLLALRDAFRGVEGPAASPEKTADAAATSAEAPALHPADAKAVRVILDINNLRAKKVENVSVTEGGRVVELYLQEGGVRILPEEIGQLAKLRVLHLYGDRNLKLPLLESVSPALGDCLELEDLLLNQNALKNLPESLTRLRKLKHLSVADNHLQDLSPALRSWLEKQDPEGLRMQSPAP